MSSTNPFTPLSPQAYLAHPERLSDSPLLVRLITLSLSSLLLRCMPAARTKGSLDQLALSLALPAFPSLSTEAR